MNLIERVTPLKFLRRIKEYDEAWEEAFQIVKTSFEKGYRIRKKGDQFYFFDTKNRTFDSGLHERHVSLKEKIEVRKLNPILLIILSNLHKYLDPRYIGLRDYDYEDDEIPKAL